MKQQLEVKQEKKIPDGWEEKNVQTTCEILDSKRIPLNSDERYEMQGDIPYYGANCVVDYINKYLFDEDLILIAEDGGNFDDYDKRSIAYNISGKSWVNNHAHILRVLKNYNFNFIFYSLEHKNVTPIIKGGTRSKLNQQELKLIPIPCPKFLKEQEKIASILQEIDNSIKMTQKLLDKYSKIKEGFIDYFFSPKENRNKINFGSVIDKLLDFRGKTPKKIGMDWNENGEGIPALSANNVEMGKINLKKETYYGSGALYEKWMNHGDCKEGDIVMTMEAPLGNIAQIKDSKKYILSQRVILLKTKKLINCDYLYNYLRSNYFQNQLYKNSSGTTASGIQQARLVKIDLYLEKDPTEQKRIADILASADKKIESEQNNLDKLIKIKRGLMQDLLTGKVRVKV